MKLPTDPQERNDQRALWAQIALAAFVAETGTDESDVLVEFLVGVMHWCDRSGEGFERLTLSAHDLCTAKRRTRPRYGMPRMLAEAAINVRRDGGHVYCVDVKLAS